MQYLVWGASGYFSGGGRRGQPGRLLQTFKPFKNIFSGRPKVFGIDKYFLRYFQFLFLIFCIFPCFLRFLFSQKLNCRGQMPGLPPPPPGHRP
jgi:hypothetical protein